MGNRESAPTVRFGRFLLDQHRRELLADGVPVPIGSRAFDILVVLVEAGGQLVTKDELMNRAWPGRIVEENCLQFHVSTLRKALGPDRDIIRTIAGRGYCFTAELSKHAGPDTASFAQHGRSQRSTDFASAVSNFISHDTRFAGLSDSVSAHRLAALVGSRDVGEMRLSTEFRRHLLSELASGAWITAPGLSCRSELVLPVVAAVLQLAEARPASPEGVTQAFASKRLLLLLIPATTVECQGRASPSEETLVTETTGSRSNPASSATATVGVRLI